MPPTPIPEPDPADHSLLRQFLLGEPRACRQVERWAWEVVDYRGYRIPRAAREDVVQLAVVGVWRAAAKPGFALQRGLRALVRSVAMARCIDWLRRQRAVAEVDEETPDPGPDPGERLGALLTGERLRRALAALDERCREIIRLHYYEELSYAEIAQRLGRLEATLRTRMFNCMKAIRRLLVAEGPGPAAGS